MIKGCYRHEAGAVVVNSPQRSPAASPPRAKVAAGYGDRDRTALKDLTIRAGWWLLVVSNRDKLGS